MPTTDVRFMGNVHNHGLVRDGRPLSIVMEQLETAGRNLRSFVIKNEIRLEMAPLIEVNPVTSLKKSVSHKRESNYFYWGIADVVYERKLLDDNIFGVHKYLIM